MSKIEVGDWIRRKGERYPQLYQRFDQDEIVGNIHWVSGKAYYDLEEFEPMPISPQDYIGMRGVFYERQGGWITLGTLKAVYKHDDRYHYAVSKTDAYQYFIPCLNTSANPEDLTPDKVFTLGPGGIVNA